MSTQNGSDRVRASDAEREQVAHILRAAMTEGRLTLAEGEERLAAAYAATYRDELGGLTTDLPGGGRHALADLPEVRRLVRRDVRRRASRLAVVAAVLVGLWVLSGAGFFWPAIPLAFLLFGLFARARFERYARAAAAGNWPDGRGRGGPCR